MGSTTLELLVEVVPFSRSPSEKKKVKASKVQRLLGSA